jgi:hypothetical protein
LGRELTPALPSGAIADLIVILYEGDEGIRRQGPTRLAASRSSKRHEFTLERKTFRECPAQLCGITVIQSVTRASLANSR